MIRTITEKLCMVCGGKETDPQASPNHNIIIIRESICNRCKAVLRDVVMKKIGLNKNTETTFDWES